MFFILLNKISLSKIYSAPLYIISTQYNLLVLIIIIGTNSGKNDPLVESILTPFALQYR